MSSPFDNLKPIDDDLKNRMLQFEIDCDDGKGNAYACHSVAEFHAVIENDHAKAASVLEKNCDGKNQYGASCFKLGRFLIMGKGVEANDPSAFKRFEKACDQGISQGCANLAEMLMEGTVVKDPARALATYNKACLTGDSESCFHFGMHLLNPSSGDRRDPLKAAETLNTACDAGHAPSCRLLAVLYKNGDTGVVPDPNKFAEFKRRTEELVMQRGAMMGVRVT
jgi:TPR repeat protein